MGRTIVLAGAIVVAGLLVRLAVPWEGDGASPPRRTERSDAVSEYRVLELEQRVDRLEALLRDALRRTPDDQAGGARDPAPTATPASPSAPASTPAPSSEPATSPSSARTAADREAHRREWLERYRRQLTPEARLGVLHDAGVQIGKYDGNAALREFLREIHDGAERGSEEWSKSAFELGYLARTERDLAAADELFRRVQGAVAPESVSNSWAEFQLGWNRRFEGDAPASEAHFRRVIAHPAAEPGTRAAARYAIANSRQEQGDSAGARAELEALVEESKEHPGDGALTYYAGLAKKLLERGS